MDTDTCLLEVRDEDDESPSWQPQSSLCESTYTHPGEPDHRYTFRLTASDNVGNEATAETQAAISRVTKYYYHGGKRVAMRTPEGVYYLHGDHLGSTSLATDAGGAEVPGSRTGYDPFGALRYGGMLPTDFGFAGQRGVPGTGLIFMNARFYYPSLGRFTQADSIVPEPGNPQAWNRYSYVLNNPLRHIDPTGHQSEPPPGISQEHHERLLKLRAIAETISARSQLSPDDPDFLTDVGAMALLFETAAPLYEHWFGPFRIEERSDFVYDLGIVVGGIEVRGTAAQHVLSYLRGESLSAIRQEAFRYIDANDPNDPLSQYYIGYDNFRRREDRLTGFRDQYAQRGENQVRHFVGGLVIAHAFWGAGRSPILEGEQQ